MSHLNISDVGTVILDQQLCCIELFEIMLLIGRWVEHCPQPKPLGNAA